ncbi:MAG: hypothetical protein HOG02_00720, partial [Porticoccaceae bacterium]|nr:hypothetical protein [Porticoccaceae bacterium]
MARRFSAGSQPWPGAGARIGASGLRTGCERVRALALRWQLIPRCPAGGSLGRHPPRAARDIPAGHGHWTLG